MKESGVRIVGFDCAEEDHSGVLLNQDGEFESHMKVVNRRDWIEAALARLVLAIPSDTELVVVVESKRSHGRLVTDVAKDLGIRIFQVNTVALNHFRDVEGQPRKDDEWDAYLAARMVYLRMKGCREVREITNEERALSRLTRSYARLTDDKSPSQSCRGASGMALQHPPAAHESPAEDTGRSPSQGGMKCLWEIGPEDWLRSCGKQGSCPVFHSLSSLGGLRRSRETRLPTHSPRIAR